MRATSQAEGPVAPAEQDSLAGRADLSCRARSRFEATLPGSDGHALRIDRRRNYWFVCLAGGSAWA